MPSDNSIHVSFELAPRDTQYFRERPKRSRASRAEEDEELVISSAAGLVKDALAAESPKFVKSRLGNLGRLISMVTDPHWRLEGRDRARVLDALAYFADLEDLIPDRIPSIGYIDDAIMIELVTRELKHEIKSYEGFCAFRKQGGKQRDDPKIANRREALQRRMRRRPRSDVQCLRSSSRKSSLRLWSY
ncbi:MAG: YkvA family protein [Myxococcales bacterium]